MKIDLVHEPDSVRSLRLTHGVSLEALARHCALSVRQLRQIEEGGSDAFYSPAIKQLAMHKVMATLQHSDSLMALQKAMERGPEPKTFQPQNNHTLAYKATRPAWEV